MFGRTQTAPAYADISIAGGDTAQPLNLGVRLNLIQRHVQLRGRKIIDCGCGAGGYVLEFLKLGADACGVEYMEEKVRAFQALGREPDRVKKGDLEKIDHPDATFDVAFLNEVLEHVPDERKALSEIRRVLKPGGTLIIFSPNRLYPFETHGAHWKASGKVIKPYATFLLPYVPLALAQRWFHFWARNYFPGNLRRLVRETGFQIVHRTFVWQTFENISGNQPAWIRAARPFLRGVASLLQRLPLARTLGVSQVIFAEKR